MEMRQEGHFYEQSFSVVNSQVDSRRLIIYDFPETLNQNGIFNILDHIGCPPLNIVLIDRKDSGKLECTVSSKTGTVAIVEFANKTLVDRAFYVITTQFKDYLNAQYAYRSAPGNITVLK